MWSKLLVFLLATYCLFKVVQSSNYPSFVQWKSQVGKAYENHIEQQYRAFIYAKNVEKIQRNNNDPSLTHKEAVNQFTDITQQEFQLTYLTLLPLPKYSQPIFRTEEVKDDQPIVGQQEKPVKPIVGKEEQESPKVRDQERDHPIVEQQQNYPIVGDQRQDHPIVGNQDQSEPIVGKQKENHPIIGQKEENPIATTANQEDSEDDSEDSDEDTPILKVNAINWNTIYPSIKIESQGICGSCYAFSAMTITSYALIMKFNVTHFFSKQELVDCSSKFGNNGCDGGHMKYCYEYGKIYNIMSQSDYPYTEKVGKCQRDEAKAGKYKISSYKHYKGCKKMLNQIQKSPLAGAVDASTWASYSSGVFSKCGSNPNHAISLVGVTKESNWIVQNSWGKKWGQNGLITLASGNTCGICKYSGYFVNPTV